MEADVLPAQIVGDDNYDIGFVALGAGHPERYADSYKNRRNPREKTSINSTQS